MISQELEELLEQAGKTGYVWWLFGNSNVLAGVRRRGDNADVLVLHDAELAHAYRTPVWPHEPLFRPQRVWWWFGGPAALTVRALLALPEPGAPDAPGTLMPIPAPSGVAGDLKPVRVRVPRWFARPSSGLSGPHEQARWA